MKVDLVRMHRPLIRIGLLAIVIAGVAACAPAAPAPGSAPATAPVATAAPATKAPVATATPFNLEATKAPPATGAPTQSAGTARRGGTMTVAQTFGPITLDPMIDPGADGIYILENVMEGLMRINDDQSIGPGLAESWKISDDQLTWTFSLRKGVTFSNGDPFNADAVVFTFQRLMDPNGVATFRALYNTNVAKVEKVDDYTVTIVMKQPWPAFPIYASTNHTKILDPKQVQAAGKDFGYTVLPVGTGFFKFDKWDRDNEVDLSRNENYWQKDLPYLDKVVYKLIKDPQVAKLAITTGQVDVLQDPPVDQLPELKKNPDLKVLDHSGGATMLVDLNLDTVPFKDVRVRKAFSLAVNRKEIVDNVFNGTAEVADDFFPSWFWANDPTFKAQEDPAQAQKLLTDAGYGPSNPLQFTLLVYNMPPYTDMGQILQAQLAKIGVKVNIQAYDSATVLQYVQQAAKRPQLQAAIFRHIARNNAWEFSGNRYSNDGKLNYDLYNKPGGLQDPAAQKIFDQLEFVRDWNPEDQAKAKPLYSQAAKIVLQDTVEQIELVHQNNVDVTRSRIQNYPSGPYDWAPYWHVWASQ